MLSIANPKELAMGAATGLVIGGLIPAPAPAVVVGVIYTVIAVLGVAVPLVAVVLLGARAEPLLAATRAWLERNNAVLMAILLLGSARSCSARGSRVSADVAPEGGLGTPRMPGVA